MCYNCLCIYIYMNKVWQSIYWISVGQEKTVVSICKYEVALGKTEDTTFSGDHLVNHFGIPKWFQESRPTLLVVF